MAGPTLKTRKAFKSTAARVIVLNEHIGGGDRRPGYGHTKPPWQRDELRVKNTNRDIRSQSR